MDWKHRYYRALRYAKYEHPNIYPTFDRPPLFWRACRILTYRPSYRETFFLAPTSSKLYVDASEWEILSYFQRYSYIRFIQAYLRKRRELGKISFYIKHLGPKSRDHLLCYCYFEVIKTHVERFIRLSHPQIVRLVDSMWLDFDLADRAMLYVWVRKMAAYLRKHPSYEGRIPSKITLDSLGEYGTL